MRKVYDFRTGVKKIKTKVDLSKTLMGLVALALPMALAVSTLSVRAADSTVVVTGNTAAGENQPGWMFNRDASTSTPYEFTEDRASIGQGSLYVQPITNTGNSRFDKFIAEYFYLESVGTFNSISYDFMIGSGGTVADANEFYLNVYTNLPGQSVTNFYDCRFDFSPSLGSTTGWTTFTVDKTSVPVHVQSRGGATCPTTLGGLPEGSTIRVFAINVGDTSFSDTGLDGYLDKVVLSTVSGTTTFDFEPTLSPANKNECKNGGWQEFNSPAFKNQGQCVAWANHNNGVGQDDNKARSR